MYLQGGTQYDRRCAAQDPAELHICFSCGGGLVYDERSKQKDYLQWLIVLKCPECLATRQGIFDRAAVGQLQRILDRATATMKAREKQLHVEVGEEEKFLMWEWIEAFAKALNRDAIVPFDFRNPTNAAR